MVLGVMSPWPYSLLALWGALWLEGGWMQALESTELRVGLLLLRFKTVPCTRYLWGDVG